MGNNPNISPLRPEDLFSAASESIKKFFTSSLFGVIITDEKGEFFYWVNDKIAALLGYRPADLMKLGVKDIIPRSESEKTFNNIKRGIGGKLPAVRNRPLVRRDGAVVYADIDFFPLKIAGKKYLAGLIFDMTANYLSARGLLQSQKELQALFNNAADPIIIMDQQAGTGNVRLYRRRSHREAF